MGEIQLELDLGPRILRDRVLKYYNIINSLMEREGVPSTYSGSSEKRAIFAYNNSDCEKWMHVQIGFVGENKATMFVDGTKNLIDILKGLIPINEIGAVQRVA